MISEFADDPQSPWGLLFDEVKLKLSLNSDAKLAQRLGVTKGFVSSVRCGRKSVSVELGRKLYSLIERPILEDELAMFMPLRVQLSAQARTQNPEVRYKVLERAAGKCELCQSPAPFLTPSGAPYLEVHHLVRIDEGGAIGPDNAVALCPNCHRQLHINPSIESLKSIAEYLALNKSVKKLRGSRIARVKSASV